ncbi:M20 family metallopeptidase [Macrococcoides caseolyticum]|uniref:Peptidase M20 domain-containing protein 2 n=1 Tax=Macrococcoides caseolyticum TaxID=69966 RepID=A0A855GP00_9STAP|nr:amidohydrolase [Macrococcus caseolyticus]PKE31219.1 amidohydrolase [Macrococcus caseolyticus]PKE36580.1 amidohydrolase [Macrococcus caseolyticus]PKE43466.1 amidohydrolase [Macrococcus caseolyticus]PKE50530.1 amidohydrolase [Macrococcus caseolyticus]
MKMNEQNVLNYIEYNKEEFIKISHQIHERPELGNEEYFASSLLIKTLYNEGFTIEHDIAGHETGFIATFESEHDGPTIAFLAEYDALPGLGHACGHNIIGTSSVLAGVSIKEYVETHGGTIKVFGTPAEEGGVNGSAKASYVKAGLFSDCDVALMIHPGHESYRTVPTLAVDVFEVEFFGKTAHASENAHNGINALDAMISFFNGIAQLRQHIRKSDKVHGVILDGGKSANIIPDYTKARFYTRAMSRKELDVLTGKVERVAKGAALTAGAEYKLSHIQNGVNEFIQNDLLDDLFERHAKKHNETILHDDFGFGSTDTGNVSHVIPTIHPHIKIGPSSLVGHTVEFKDAAGSAHGDHALIQGAKIMATMALELIDNPDELKAIKNLHTVLKGKVYDH